MAQTGVTQLTNVRPMTMNKRLAPRTTINRPIHLHYFGEQVDISLCTDYSESGFFINTPTGLELDKGVVALVTIGHGPHSAYRCLAEVVRLTEDGAGFQIIEKTESPIPTLES